MRWKQVDGALAALSTIKDPRGRSRTREQQARLRNELDRIEQEFWRDWLAERGGRVAGNA
jgi:hypothetical protein